MEAKRLCSQKILLDGNIPLICLHHQANLIFFLRPSSNFTPTKEDNFTDSRRHLLFSQPPLWHLRHSLLIGFIIFVTHLPGCEALSKFHSLMFLFFCFFARSNSPSVAGISQELKDNHQIIITKCLFSTLLGTICMLNKTYCFGADLHIHISFPFTNQGD